MDGGDADARAPLLGGGSDGYVDPPENLYEAYASPYIDENLLQELRSIHEHDVEAGGGAAAPEELPHTDEDVFKMKELIAEKPEDVLHYIEGQGVLRVCEFEVQDSLAFKAFQNDSILTMGADHFEMQWEDMWRERLADSGKASGTGWTTSVLLEAHVVNLRDAAAQGSRGLLQPLLKRYQAGGCSMAVFALPAVQAVIHFKWNKWARRFLLIELGAYVTWLLAFTSFTLLFQQEDGRMSFWAMISTWCGFGATAASALCVAAMLPFLWMELCTIRAYSHGWAASPWNLLDMVSYGLQIAISVLHLQREYVDEGWFSVMIAAQHVLMWTKLQYFARVFNPTKTTFIDTIRLVIEDMKWFLLFLLMTMVGFGMAFYALYRQDRDKFPDFANVWHALASMFSYLLAMFDYNVFYNSTNPTAAMILFIIFEFVMNVMMLNIMIASMTNSFSKVTQDEGLRFLHSKAEIIDELEATLPAWLKARGWFPPFIHILKFHPDSTHEVNLNSLWSGIGLMETNLLNAQEETRRRVEDIEDRTSRVHRKLDVLIKLTLSLQPSLAAPGGAAGAAAVDSCRLRRVQKWNKFPCSCRRNHTVAEPLSSKWQNT